MSIPESPRERRAWLLEKLPTQVDLRPLINGDRPDIPGSSQIPLRDVYQDEVVGSLPAADAATVDQAVESARDAFDKSDWRFIHPRARARYLYCIAEEIERRLDVITLYESFNVGKPISGVRAWDVPNAAEVFRYYAGWADKIHGTALPDFGGATITVTKEPVGVCAAIMPWNFPFADLAWKVAPALAAGCTVVVKSAERAPLSAQILADIAQSCGLPPGVLNIIAGTGEEAGSYLASHRGIDKISFTGSTETATRVVEGSSNHLPRIGLELGGKSPNVILADADLDAAAAGAIGAMFSVSGQDCGAGSRLLVDEAVRDEFVTKLLANVERRVIGDPLENSTQQGPLIDEKHIRRVEDYVAQAQMDGGRLLCGGGRLDGERSQCFAPTVLEGVSAESPAWIEEIFGPVGIVRSFSGLDEAIGLANDTKFGLAGGVWTASTASAERFVRELRVGTVWVNCYGWFDTTSPWGGRGASGFGKELGFEGLEEYLLTKSTFRVGR